MSHCSIYFTIYDSEAHAWFCNLCIDLWKKLFHALYRLVQCWHTSLFLWLLGILQVYAGSYVFLKFPIFSWKFINNKHCKLLWFFFSWSDNKLHSETMSLVHSETMSAKYLTLNHHSLSVNHFYEKTSIQKKSG